MSIAKAKPIGHAVPGELRLSDFFDGVRDSKPFASVRVSEPSPFDVDVATIHAAAFDKLVTRAGQALKERRGIGVVLMGTAGVGKSHLLSRLYRWSEAKAEKDRPRACY